MEPRDAGVRDQAILFKTQRSNNWKRETGKRSRVWASLKILETDTASHAGPRDRRLQKLRQQWWRFHAQPAFSDIIGRSHSEPTRVVVVENSKDQISHSEIKIFSIFQ